MELMYPVVIIICLIFLVVIVFFKFDRKEKYTDGKKVANTKYIKETKYYQEKVKKYRIFSNILKVLSIACILITSILVARPVVVHVKSEDKYNRDILLGLDISTSESEVNLELIQKFRKIIPEIEGDRIGIVLYNTAPLVFCPLTEDYEYINECFDDIEEQLKIVIENNGNPKVSYEVDGVEKPMIWYGGVGADSSTRGSSLVGDGLVGTIFSFPDVEEDDQRTRIILFATDNDVGGKEIVSLDEACNFCRQYKINLYAYCPTVQMNPYTSEEKIASYRKAVEQSAGGKFYTGDLDEMASTIVNEIQSTKTSLLKTSKKTYVTDYPEVFLISIIILFFILIIIEKRIKL